MLKKADQILAEKLNNWRAKQTKKLQYVAGHSLQEFERKQYIENKLFKILNFLNSDSKKQLIQNN